jgi:hypothetical protein
MIIVVKNAEMRAPQDFIDGLKPCVPQLPSVLRRCPVHSFILRNRNANIDDVDLTQSWRQARPPRACSIISTNESRAAPALTSDSFTPEIQFLRPVSQRSYFRHPTRTVTVAGSSEKCCHRNVPCAGKFLDALNRRIARSVFDVRNVSPIQTGTKRQFSLGNPKNESRAPDCRS